LIFPGPFGHSSPPMDVGNVVFIGLSSANTLKLQSILNAAARLIGGIPKFAHSSSVYTVQNPFKSSDLPAILCTLVFTCKDLVVFWLFRSCALLWPNPRALPMLASQLGYVFHSPCAWNIPITYASCGNALRLSCSPALQALAPL